MVLAQPWSHSLICSAHCPPVQSHLRETCRPTCTPLLGKQAWSCLSQQLAAPRPGLHGRPFSRSQLLWRPQAAALVAGALRRRQRRRWAGMRPSGVQMLQWRRRQ